MSTARRKIAILCWDVGHNPLGRGYLLADLLRAQFEIELIGPVFPRYGSDVWAPLRNAGPVPIKWYDGQLFPEHMNQLEELAQRIEADLIMVSKPRLPSFGLGILTKVRRNLPLILDVDDYELGFFPPGPATTVSRLANRRPTADLLEPYSKPWTACCEELVPYVDAVTVASVAIQRKYGGTIIPHARDETVFDPKRFDRAAIRSRFGYGPDDRVILFLGTPRAHKGLVRIAEALAELNNEKYCLCIIGSPQDRIIKELPSRFPRVRIDMFPDQPFSDLPANLLLADLICLLQDPANITAQYQVPAKFTDALAMEVPIIGTSVQPFRDLANEGLIELVENGTLSEKIDHIFTNYDLFKSRAVRNRSAFMDRYSFGAARQRLIRLVENVLERGPKESHELREFVQFQLTVIDTLSGAKLDRRRTYLQPPYNEQPQETDHGRRQQLSIAFFWKQNDTGIFGRRNDMIAKYLSAHSRVSSAVHFDPPIEVRDLLKLFDFRFGRKFRQNKLIFWATLYRILCLHDTSDVMHRTFLYVSRDGSLISKLLSMFFADRSAYGKFIERQLSRARFDRRNTILYVSPVNFEYQEILHHVKPSLIVGDIVDDQRTWPMKDRYRKALDQNYREILFDCHVAFANNDNTRRSMSKFNRNIYVVPNGLDHVGAKECLERRPPRRLSRIPRPILGYAGNLDPDRLDCSLLDYIAKQRPGWQIVLIGSAHKGEDALRLCRHPNIHILGVIPYPDVMQYVAQFDVALIPHKNNEMTQHMNPLKMFVYLALGIPIVSTAIENIEELEGSIIAAANPDTVIQSVEAILAEISAPRESVRQAIHDQHSWESRVSVIIDLIDKHVQQMHSSSA